MGALRREFDRFLLWLTQRETSPDVRRLANGISAHLDEIAGTSTAQGARARTIVRLLLRSFIDLEDVLHVPVNAATIAGVPWTRLNRLEVGPFRGFTKPEVLDLNKRVVLIYGPNGTGKSSLCEAIELALTGAVSEASAKRMAEADYCRNAHAGAFAAPRLMASGAAGEEHVVTGDPDALRFCVIEKNRIDEFSRISARTPREQARSIAALFGIDQFDHFVANFNESIDGQLDLVGRRSTALKAKRLAIEADLQLLAAADIRRREFDDAELALAQEFDPAFTFERLSGWIGTPERPARLAQLTELLDLPAPQPVGLSPETLNRLAHAVDEGIASVARLDAQLQTRARDLSYKQLYEAVQALQQDSPEHCPACSTPLAGTRQVARNPYEKARTGLAQLEELARLERQRSEAISGFATNSRMLRGALDTVVMFAEPRGLLSHCLVEHVQGLPVEPDPTTWNRFREMLIEGNAAWGLVNDVATRIAIHDAEAQADSQNRAKLREERSRLQSFDRRVLAQRTARDTLEASVADAKSQVRQFEAENQQLIDEANLEAPLVARNLRLKDAYDNLLDLLRAYRDGLPSTLLAGLNTATRDLYNAFNRDDDETEKLAEVRLPTATHWPLQIAFPSAPDRFLDALHVLSEGHIRCLGLSILVAKIIQQGCPVVVFDDAVNAIDDDHRNGICNTLFRDEWLRDKQIILTCHGEEFIKTIQRDLGADVVLHDSLLYVFRPRKGNRPLDIDTRPRTRNYVLLARQSLDALEIREALSQSRRALEGITERIWKWLGTMGHGELRLNIKRHGAHPELRNLAEALLRDLSDPHFEHERKAPLRAGLSALLGIQAGALEWAYLNGGTHESDRLEFDRAVVQTIVEAIEWLDKTLSPRR